MFNPFAHPVQRSISYSFSSTRLRLLLISGLLSMGCLMTVQADSQYSYDAAGRLTQVIAANGITTSYQYDLNDNLIAIQQTSPLVMLPVAVPPQTIGLPKQQSRLSLAENNSASKREMLTQTR